MPWSNLDATLLVDHAPEFEYRDGLYIANITSGTLTIRLVFRPHTLFETHEYAARIMAEGQNRITDNVVMLARQ